jgi:hypothetical protein
MSNGNVRLRVGGVLGVTALTLLIAACGDDGLLDPTASLQRSESGVGSTLAGHASTGGSRCDGTLGPVSVENVEVAAGATCVLDATRVEGNVLVREGATLEALGARIRGNVQAEDAARVYTAAGTTVGGDIQVKRRADTHVVDTTIDGNLQVEEGGASLRTDGVTVLGDLQVTKAESADVSDTDVSGNLQLVENRGRLAVTASDVFGDLQVVKNSGGVSLVGNRVAQSLQCDENHPAPEGSGNDAGEKEGQCEAL